MRWERIALVGVTAGFLSGLFGVGGGIVIVPGLVLLARCDQKLAIGTSLGAIVPISVAGAFGYATADHVDYAAAALVALGALAGTVVGTALLVRLRSHTLQYAFAGLLLVTAARLFLEEGDGGGRGDLTAVAVVALVVVGVSSGVLAGMFGVGGGVLIVPALTIGFGLPLAVAKGTSLFVIPTAVAGTLRNRRSGFTALRPAVVVGLAGVVTAWLASKLSVNLDPTVSAALFGALLVIVAVRLVGTARRDQRIDAEAAAASAG
ncbi:MAG: sulfite exporter TauE/SafE family protein [Acidimicrobiales bacterium]